MWKIAASLLFFRPDTMMLFGDAKKMTEEIVQALGTEGGWSMRRIGYAVAALIFWPCIAAARPMQMRESRPAAGTIIHGHHAEYFIRFDGPVDHAASRMQITQSGHVVQALHPRLDSAVDVLFASGAAPAPGRYLLHWEARSMDGDVSAGDIPFDVAP